jgi:pyrimidine-nucleoside phosphorylase
VEAALRILRGEGPPDLTELVGTLGAAMLVLGGAADSWEAAGERFANAVTSGEGTKRFRAMVQAQGGDAAVVDDPGRLPTAPVTHPVPAPRDGVVTDVEPRALGEAVVDLGGGRRKAEDTVDPAVGVRIRVRPGDRVGKGETLAEVLAADDETAGRVAEERVKPAFAIGDREPTPRTLVRYLVTGDGHEEWAGADTWDRSRGTRS